MDPVSRGTLRSTTRIPATWTTLASCKSSKKGSSTLRSRRRHRAGLQIALHAVGQRAFDMALRAYARVDDDGSLRAMRHRIEHAYYPPLLGRFERMRDLGLVWSTQPAEIDEVGEDWIRVFTRDRLDGLMPLRSALDLGIPTVINSDYPVTSIDPFVGIRAAVTRRTAAGTVLDPAEAVAVTDALRMMTTGPAYIEGAEDRQGQPGAREARRHRDPLTRPAGDPTPRHSTTSR